MKTSNSMDCPRCNRVVSLPKLLRYQAIATMLKRSRERIRQVAAEERLVPVQTVSWGSSGSKAAFFLEPYVLASIKGDQEPHDKFKCPSCGEYITFPQLLTVADMPERLGVKTQMTVYTFIWDNKLIPFDGVEGGARPYLFTELEVQRFCDHRRRIAEIDQELKALRRQGG